MNKLPVKQAQEIPTEIRKNPRLNGVWDMECESGQTYLVKNPALYKKGQPRIVEYVEIRKPKQGGGEWVNRWAQEPKTYTPKQKDNRFDDLMGAVSEIQGAIVALDSKVDGIIEDLKRRP